MRLGCPTGQTGGQRSALVSFAGGRIEFIRVP
jgi:hypothetical protein